MSRRRLPGPSIHILFICTGNICRSPMAERICAARIGSAFGVSSAGTWAQKDAPMQSHAASVLREHGVDPAGFRTRQLTAEMVTAADLVLTAGREHRAAAVRLSPRAASRTFTVREFGRLTAGFVAREFADVGSVIEAAHRRRGHMGLTPVTDDDVADPYGRSVAAFRGAAATIVSSLERAFPLLAAVAGDGPDAMAAFR